MTMNNKVHKDLKDIHKLAECDKNCCRNGCSPNLCVNYISCGEYYKQGDKQCFPCKHCLFWSKYKIKDQELAYIKYLLMVNYHKQQE